LLKEHNSVIKEKETVKNGYMKCLNTYDEKEKEFQRLLKLAMFYDGVVNKLEVD